MAWRGRTRDLWLRKAEIPEHFRSTVGVHGFVQYERHWVWENNHGCMHNFDAGFAT